MRLLPESPSCRCIRTKTNPKCPTSNATNNDRSLRSLRPLNTLVEWLLLLLIPFLGLRFFDIFLYMILLLLLMIKCCALEDVDSVLEGSTIVMTSRCCCCFDAVGVVFVRELERSAKGTAEFWSLVSVYRRFLEKA